MLQDKEEASAVFAAVNMNVVEVYRPLASFMCYVCSKALGQRSFACSNVACYYYSLGHFSRRLQCEAKEFLKQVQFLLSVGKSIGNVVDVELRLVFEHIPIMRHSVEPQL